eukprot:5492779-Amphidinium_carterae.1
MASEPQNSQPHNASACQWRKDAVKELGSLYGFGGLPLAPTRVVQVACLADFIARGLSSCDLKPFLGSRFASWCACVRACVCAVQTHSQ